MHKTKKIMAWNHMRMAYVQISRDLIPHSPMLEREETIRPLDGTRKVNGRRYPVWECNS